MTGLDNSAAAGPNEDDIRHYEDYLKSLIPFLGATQKKDPRKFGDLMRQMYEEADKRGIDYGVATKLLGTIVDYPPLIEKAEEIGAQIETSDGARHAVSRITAQNLEEIIRLLSSNGAFKKKNNDGASLSARKKTSGVSSNGNGNGNGYHPPGTNGDSKPKSKIDSVVPVAPLPKVEKSWLDELSEEIDPKEIQSALEKITTYFNKSEHTPEESSVMHQIVKKYVRPEKHAEFYALVDREDISIFNVDLYAPVAALQDEVGTYGLTMEEDHSIEELTKKEAKKQVDAIFASKFDKDLDHANTRKIISIIQKITSRIERGPLLSSARKLTSMKKKEVSEFHKQLLAEIDKTFIYDVTAEDAPYVIAQLQNNADAVTIEDRRSLVRIINRLVPKDQREAMKKDLETLSGDALRTRMTDIARVAGLPEVEKKPDVIPGAVVPVSKEPEINAPVSLKTRKPTTAKMSDSMTPDEEKAFVLRCLKDFSFHPDLDEDDVMREQVYQIIRKRLPAEIQDDRIKRVKDHDRTEALADELIDAIDNPKTDAVSDGDVILLPDLTLEDVVQKINNYNIRRTPEDLLGIHQVINQFAPDAQHEALKQDLETLDRKALAKRLRQIARFTGLKVAPEPRTQAKKSKVDTNAQSSPAASNIEVVPPVVLADGALSPYSQDAAPISYTSTSSGPESVTVTGYVPPTPEVVPDHEELNMVVRSPEMNSAEAAAYYADQQVRVSENNTASQVEVRGSVEATQPADPFYINTSSPSMDKSAVSESESVNHKNGQPDAEIQHKVQLLEESLTKLTRIVRRMAKNGVQINIGTSHDAHKSSKSSVNGEASTTLNGRGNPTELHTSKYVDDLRKDFENKQKPLEKKIEDLLGKIAVLETALENAKKERSGKDKEEIDAVRAELKTVHQTVAAAQAAMDAMAAEHKKTMDTLHAEHKETIEKLQEKTKDAGKKAVAAKPSGGGKAPKLGVQLGHFSGPGAQNVLAHGVDKTTAKSLKLFMGISDEKKADDHAHPAPAPAKAEKPEVKKEEKPAEAPKEEKKEKKAA